MRICFSILALITIFSAKAQEVSVNEPHEVKQKYYSFNPISLAEPHMAIGLGFGNRFTERSEYFAELSYLNKSPFYDIPVESLWGLRMILQYRYHFLQQWKPLLGNTAKYNKSRHEPFMGFEFRTKTYNFSDKASFVNAATADTLRNYSYKANATGIGGAILFGSSYDFGQHGRVRLEVTWGIGAKQKLVAFRNVPSHYKIPEIPPHEWGFIPKVYETNAVPYFPFAMRVRILID